MGSPEVVCWHEAGHVVAYLVHDIPIDCVRVYESNSGDWAGWLIAAKSVAKVTDPPSEKEVRLRALLVMLGPMTTGSRFGPGDRRGDANDRDTADRLLMEHFRVLEDFITAKGELLEEAQRFVHDAENWAAIGRLAGRMLARVEGEIKKKDYPREVSFSGKELQDWFRE
jgi:hypothetical protein